MDNNKTKATRGKPRFLHKQAPADGLTQLSIVSAFLNGDLERYVERRKINQLEYMYITSTGLFAPGGKGYVDEGGYTEEDYMYDEDGSYNFEGHLEYLDRVIEDWQREEKEELEELRRQEEEDERKYKKERDESIVKALFMYFGVKQE